MEGEWAITEYDEFEGSYYPRPETYPTERDAQQAARARLVELEKNQPSHRSGGQGFFGVQDRVYIVRPDGSQYRFMG